MTVGGDDTEFLLKVRASVSIHVVQMSSPSELIECHRLESLVSLGSLPGRRVTPIPPYVDV